MSASNCPECDGSNFVDFDNGEGSVSYRRCEACLTCPECEGAETITVGCDEVMCEACDGSGRRPLVETRSRWSAAQLASVFAAKARVAA